VGRLRFLPAGRVEQRVGQDQHDRPRLLVQHRHAEAELADLLLHLVVREHHAVGLLGQHGSRALRHPLVLRGQRVERRLAPLF
jgi:hypothetical protein